MLLKLNQQVLSKQPEKAKKIRTCKYFNYRLDDRQRQAVDFAFANDFSVIHGPPGTGKTATLIEIVRQAYANNLRILVCGASNCAIDSIIEELEKINESKQTDQIKFVRFGRPARASDCGRRYTVDYWLNDSLDPLQMKRLKKLMKRIETDVKARKKVQEVFDYLIEKRDDKTEEIVSRRSVVIGTLVSASPMGQLKMMLCKPDFWFDLVVIDELSQSLEPAAWMVIPLAKRLVLGGDHLQLPPVIFSRKAALGLELTLMDRCIQMFSENVITLNVQYRMNQELMEWPSKYFYQGELKAHSSVRDIHIKDISESLQNLSSICFLDTSGCAMRETRFANSKSSCNIFEAKLVLYYILMFVRANNVPEEKIGVISPYLLQRRLLERLIKDEYPKVEIKSVDGFQGREKDIIIVSFVRSNTQQLVGFLSSEQRINVSITRARRHLTIVGDSSTLKHDSTLCNLIEHIKRHGKVREIRKSRELLLQLHSSQNHDFIKSLTLDETKSILCNKDTSIYDESSGDELYTDYINDPIHGLLSEASDPGFEPYDGLEDCLADYSAVNYD